MKKKEIDPLALHKLLKNKSFVINFRMNTDLTKMLDKAIEKDEDITGRSGWFETQVINYLRDRGGLG